MPRSAMSGVEALRAEQWRIRHGGLVLRIWGTLRGEWQRMMDRATGQAVLVHRLPRV